MKSIVEVFKAQLKIARERKWEKIYVAVDFHGTLIHPDYATFDPDNLNLTYYPYAVQAMKMMTNNPLFTLFTYTASYLCEVKAYVEAMEKEGIKFDFINENPEVRTEEQNWGNFDQKPYFNVLLDDKAGFDPFEDWKAIAEFLVYNYGTKAEQEEFERPF